MDLPLSRRRRVRHRKTGVVSVGQRWRRGWRVERIAVTAGGVGTGVFALIAMHVVVVPELVRDLYLYDFINLAAVIAVAARACRDRRERVAWGALAIGLTASMAGDTYSALVLEKLDSPPYPSWADAGYLLFYPLAYVCLIKLLRRRVTRWHASLWLDGLVLVCGIAALGAACLLAPVLQVTHAPFAVVATNLAYPLTDLVLVSTVLAGAWLVGRRIDATWALLGTGILVWGVADGVYLLQDSAGTYTPGGVLDVGWLVGTVLLSSASVPVPAANGSQQAGNGTLIGAVGDGGTGPDLAHGEAGSGWALLAIPMTVAMISLGLLLPWSGWQAIPVARWLAAGALCAVGARTMLTYREVRALADARTQARTDELTGLINRRGFTQMAQDYLAGLPDPDPNPDTSLSAQASPALIAADMPGTRDGSTANASTDHAALLLLDLDRFKEVNDSLGHHAGDQLLIEIARRLTQACHGPADVLARLGGDEFAVLLAATNLRGAEQIAARIHAALAEPFLLDGVRVQAEISIGIAITPRHGRTLSLLMRRADIAMYRAKTSRTGTAIYDPGLHDPNEEDRLQRVHALRTAIDQDQIVVHYQPKINLLTGDVTGVEALVRWDHPTEGLLYPGAFLPLAEEAGLMPALTATVLDHALTHAASWHRDGRDLAVAVNLPPATIVDAALPDRIDRLLTQHGVPPERLKLEITEESLLDDRVRARQVLAQLRQIGVHISIDDYGSGYSSLAYLRELPVDELKLDRSFIFPMADDARAAAIVRSTIELAHSLGLSIIAEGVEHSAAAEELTRYGCDGAQGFYYARALHPTELTWWLDNRQTPPPTQPAPINPDNPPARLPRPRSSDASSHE